MARLFGVTYGATEARMQFIAATSRGRGGLRAAGVASMGASMLTEKSAHRFGVFFYMAIGAIATRHHHRSPRGSMTRTRRLIRGRTEALIDGIGQSVAAEVWHNLAADPESLNDMVCVTSEIPHISIHLGETSMHAC